MNSTWVLFIGGKEGFMSVCSVGERLNIVSPSVSDAGQSFENNDLLTNPLMPDLEDSIGIFRGAYDDEDVGAEADIYNLETITPRLGRNTRRNIMDIITTQ
ncbi:hypothetical protein Tco_0541244 [Tanacetum coccineum]